MKYFFYAMIFMAGVASVMEKAHAADYYFNGVKMEQNVPQPVFSEDQIFNLEGSLETKRQLEVIKKTYRVSDDEAKEILNTIIKNTSSKSFPTKAQVLAVISIESSFKKTAQSSSSTGLMQINSSAWKVKKQKMLDIESNIKQGIRVLRSYHEQHDGNLRATLLSYNVGPTAFRRGEYNEAYWIKFQQAYKMFS